MNSTQDFLPVNLISSDYNPMRELQRKQNHNEAEKKRVRNINKCVEDLKVILDVRSCSCIVLQNANISHKSDKVSTLETAVSYMRELMKERDRLNTNLGCTLYYLNLNPRHQQFSFYRCIG